MHFYLFLAPSGRIFIRVLKPLVVVVQYWLFTVHVFVRNLLTYYAVILFCTYEVDEC